MRPFAPILLYAVFGTSRGAAWACGGGVTENRRLPWQYRRSGHDGLCVAALTLALLSGCHASGDGGVFKLGFLANFLSHPVISGFYHRLRP